MCVEKRYVWPKRLLNYIFIYIFYDNGELLVIALYKYKYKQLNKQQTELRSKFVLF